MHNEVLRASAYCHVVILPGQLDAMLVRAYMYQLSLVPEEVGTYYVTFIADI